MPTERDWPKLAASEFVEMREERDDALSALGAAECARDDYRATVNQVCAERDRVLTFLRSLGRDGRVPDEVRGDISNELRRWFNPEGSPDAD